MTATTRASLAAYNTPDEVDALLDALDRVPAIFGVAQLMDLYQELILEHSKRPHRAGLREPFDAEVHHVNPTCGDEVTLRVHVERQPARRRGRRRLLRRARLLDHAGVGRRCWPTRSSGTPSPRR